MRRAWAFTGAYAVVASAVLANALMQIRTFELPELIQWLVVALALSASQVELGTAIMPMSIPITAAAQLVLPTHLVVIIDALVGFYATWHHRRQLLNLVFNVANHVMPAFIAGALYTLTGFRSRAFNWSSILVAAMILGIRYVLPLLAGSLFVTWRDKKKPLAVFTEIIRNEGWSAPGNQLISLLIMAAYPYGGLPALLLGAGLVVSMTHSAQLYAKRDLLLRTAKRDGLTNVGNRHAWQELVAELSVRPQGPYLVASFDLDGMKTVNDTLGHEVGDKVLCSFARALTRVAGQNNVFRFGGDEFIALFAHKGPGDLFEVQQTLFSAMEDFENEWANRNIRVSASVGIGITDNAPSLPEALRAADHAMYTHKRRNAR